MLGDAEPAGVDGAAGRVDTRVCPSCRIKKPLTDYHIRRKSGNGRANTCKVCYSNVGKNTRMQARVLRGEEAWPVNGRAKLPIPLSNTRVCNKCKIEKPLTEFHKHKAGAYGRSSQCHECWAPYHLAKYIENSKKPPISTGSKPCSNCGVDKDVLDFSLSPGTKDGRKAVCRGCISERDREKNRKTGKYLEYSRSHKKENRDYRDRNRKELSKKAQERIKKRRREDSTFKLICNIRSRISGILRGKAKKTANTERLLGCSWEESVKHREALWWPGMSWENYGHKKGVLCWHDDHMVPLASFDLSDPEQQKIAFNINNIQPLWEDDNRKKWDRLDWSPSESKHELPERLKAK